MSKPSILIVPGSFSLPDVYDTVVNTVAAKGYEIKAIELMSAGLKSGPRQGEPATMYDDAVFIAKEITRLTDEGKDVILIPHSYGGTPATESIKGLGKEERKKQGKKGGVVRLAYMTCLIPAVGTPAGSVLAMVLEEDKAPITVDENGWMWHKDIPRTAELCFSELPKEEQVPWAKRFVCHTTVSFSNELTYAGYKDVPVSYLLCENDLIIPPKIQRDEIKMIERDSGNKVDVTSVPADHCVPITSPQKVANWILDLAAKDS